MSDLLEVSDLSPIKGLEEDWPQWLAELQEVLRTSDHVIRLGEAERDEDFVISRDPYGNWQTGRYIGELAFEGRRLRIVPRLGEETITEWLAGALNLVAVPETAVRRSTEAFLASLMGVVWARALDAASRHGPPAIRREHQHEGLYVRGGLDVRRSSRLRGAGSVHVASTTRPRDLDNDVSRTLVAAERVLSQHIGHTRWRTPRVRQVLPQLVAAVGARPPVPSDRALRRIRYTPITRPFKEVAVLSARIARQQGFAASGERGKAEGLLLDVAELWELFLLHCARVAFAGCRVEHGATVGRDAFLLRARRTPDKRLGRLRPDILVRENGSVVAILDAKYKRLVDFWPERPAGVDRGDLYQLATYLSRHDPNGSAIGALLYPLDARDDRVATAETEGPWTMASDSPVVFTRIPTRETAAVAELRQLTGIAPQS